MDAAGGDGSGRRPVLDPVTGPPEHGAPLRNFLSNGPHGETHLLFGHQVRARDAEVTTRPGTSTGACAAVPAVPAVQTQWSTGYVIQPLTVTNTGTSAITGWTVAFTLPAGHTMTGSWNGTATVSGQTVTIRNAGHNGALAPGASTGGLGFQVSRPNGDTALPSGYTCA